MSARTYPQWIIGAIFLSLLLLPAGCTSTPTPPPPAPPVSVDSDQDNVPDNVDLCPDTPIDMVVDAHGCLPVTDEDRDGVMDTEDLCPQTPVLTVVDARGCPLPPAVILPEPSLTLYLEFPTNEAEVSTKFTEDMKNIADFVASNPGRRFIIEGHTDSVGNELDNMKLSLLRAKNISAFLSDNLGVPPALLEARGFGESNPVAGNDTQEGRQQNRRIVIIAIPR